MLKNKTVLFINDTSDECHWGSFATSEVIKSEIKKRKPSQIEIVTTVEIAVISSIPENNDQLESAVAGFVKNNKSICKKIENSDILIINGEGTVHGFSPRARALLYIMYIARKKYCKKVYIINHSCFFESDSKNVRDFYKACYECCDYVATREYASHKNLNELGIKNVLAFDSMPLTIRQISEKIPYGMECKKTICLSGGVNFKKSKIRIIAFWLNLLFPRHDFIFLCGGLNPDNPNDNMDMVTAEKMSRYFRGLKIIRAESLEKWLEYIKSADILVTGRFHYAIARLAFGGGLVALESNTPKTSEVFKMFGLPPAARYKGFMFGFAWRLIFMRNTGSLLNEMCELAENNYKWGQDESLA